MLGYTSKCLLAFATNFVFFDTFVLHCDWGVDARIAGSDALPRRSDAVRSAIVTEVWVKEV